MSNSDFPRLRYSDVVEVPVLPLGTIPHLAAGGLADAVTAETTAGCKTSSLNTQGCTQLDIFVDVTAVPAASKLFLKVRFSGKQSPSVDLVSDWGFVNIDNIDTATGASSLQEYVAVVDLVNVNGVGNVQPRRYSLRIERISGRHVSAVVWSDTAGVTAEVSFQRQGGSM